MEQLEHLSFKGQKALFARLEELARIANMNKKERDEYEACLKVYRDNYSIALYRKRQEEAKFQEGLQIGTAPAPSGRKTRGLLFCVWIYCGYARTGIRATVKLNAGSVREPANGSCAVCSVTTSGLVMQL